MGLAVCCLYPVRVIWGVLGEDERLCPETTVEELLQIKVVWVWANAHPYKVLLEPLLAKDNLRQYLAHPTNLRFLLQEGGPPVRDHPPSPPIKEKGKKSRKMSSALVDFEDFLIPSGEPYEVLLITRSESFVPTKTLDCGYARRSGGGGGYPDNPTKFPSRVIGLGREGGRLHDPAKYLGRGWAPISLFPSARSIKGPTPLASNKTAGDKVGLEEVIDVVPANAQLVVLENYKKRLRWTNGRLKKIFTKVTLLPGASGTLF